jgi:hypothetical protein
MRKLMIGEFTEKLFQTFAGLRDAVKGFKVIDIRTAAEQYYISANVLCEQANDVLDLFEAVMPPFPRCIFEFQGGERQFVIHGEDEEGEIFEFSDAAALVETMPVSPENKIKLDNHYPGQDAAYCMTISFAWSEEGKPHLFARNMTIILTKQGYILKDGNNRPILGFRDDVSIETWTDFFLIGIAPVLFALTLMHCKNVTIESVTAPLPLSKNKSKRRKQIAERKKYPPFERHTIVIRDKKGRVVQTGQRLEGAAKGLHWVRGHFHTYTPERPLFGNPKLHGRFWVPAHIAGLNPERVIESDYLLEVA